MSERFYSDRIIDLLLEGDAQILAEAPEEWSTTHGYVYRQDTGRMVVLCDLPANLAREWRGETDIARSFANARVIVHAKRALGRNNTIIKQLRRERDAERAERDKLSAALLAKDAAMDVLFDRLTKAGVDYSDLIS